MTERQAVLQCVLLVFLVISRALSLLCVDWDGGETVLQFVSFVFLCISSIVLL